MTLGMIVKSIEIQRVSAERAEWSTDEYDPEAPHDYLVVGG